MLCHFIQSGIMTDTVPKTEQKNGNMERRCGLSLIYIDDTNAGLMKNFNEKLFLAEFLNRKTEKV